MKLPNGYGNVSRMSGNRRRPWRVRITVGWEINEETGREKQISKTLGYFETKKEAMLALAEYNQAPYDLTNKDITFEIAYKGWSEKHYEKYPSSFRGLSAAYKVCAPLYNMRMGDIRLKHLQDVMDTIKEKSVSTQTNLKTVFLKTFTYCMENDIIKKDYSQFVKIHQTEKKDISNKYFTEAEIKKLLANQDFTAVVSHGRGKGTKRVEMQLVDSVIILLYTGIRIGELLSLKCSDVDIENRTIYVPGTKTEAADRKVPIHKDLIPYLEKRLALGTEYLIPNGLGEQFDDKAYRKYFFNPLAELLGAPHLTPHATRHTFISIMDNCGVSTESVVLKRMVGHSNKSVTQHYTHKDIEQMIKAIDKYKLL